MLLKALSKGVDLKCGYKLFLCILAYGFISTSPAVANFSASVVTVDITPDSPKMLLGYSARKSTGIRDRIHHKIVVMDDGTTRFVLVSTEICVMSPSEYDHMAQLLKKELGIDPVNFWWTVTHTHSAPEVGVPGLPEVFMGDRYKHDVDTAYTQFVEQTLLEGVKKAFSQLQPSRLNAGWGFSQANINRRAIGPNGKASLGLNPDGAVDRRIGLIRIDDIHNNSLALIVNYPIHGTVFGPANLDISGDVQGVVSTYVEQKTGVPVLFINGAAGNLAPLYSVSQSVYGNKDSELDQLCVFLGDKIIEANKKILPGTDTIQLFLGKTVIETPRKKDMGWPGDLGEYSRTTATGVQLVRLPVRFLKINEDIAIWSLPVELFCEISNEIRDRSPFPYTFYFGYTNGWLGYLPTAEEWKYGGYEVEVVSPYTPEAEKHVKETVIGFLKGELKSNN